MANNNIRMSLSLDSSQYEKEFQRVIGNTSARTKEGVTVALNLALNKREITNAKKIIRELNGASYTVGGKKHTINTGDIVSIFDNAKILSSAYSTLNKRTKGIADKLLRLNSYLGDSYNRYSERQFSNTTERLRERYQTFREDKAAAKAEEKKQRLEEQRKAKSQRISDNYDRRMYLMRLKELSDSEKAEFNRARRAKNSDYESSSNVLARMRNFYNSGWNRNTAEAVRQNKIDLQEAYTRRKAARNSNDLQAEIAANKELIKLLVKKARLKKDSRYIEQARELRNQTIELNRQAKAIRENEKAAIRFENALKRQSPLLRALGGFARRYLNIFMIAGIVERIAKMTGYFQQQQVALEGILGSASKAQAVINSVKIQALKSPFTTEQIVGNVKQIAAYGIPAEDLVPTAKMLGDLSAGLGVDMNRLILAYGQVKSASVLRGQELRQFTEAGVPMVQKLADKFTELNGRLVTTGEVFELISKRQVSFEMVAEVLKDMTSEGGQFYNMQENVMDTLYGQIGKLKDMWTLSLNDIGSTFGKTLMGVVKGLQYAMKNFAFVLFTLIGRGLFGAIASPFKIYIQTIVAAKRHTDLYRSSLLALRHVFRGVNLATFGINAAITALSVALGAIVNKIVKMREFEKEMSKISESFSKDTAKMVVGLEHLVGKLKTFPEQSKQFKEAMSTILSNYADYISESDIAKIREINNLDERSKAWDKLTESITSAIEARKMYEMHTNLQQEAGDKAISNNIQGIIDMLSGFHEKIGVQNTNTEYASISKERDAMYDKIRRENIKEAISASLNFMKESGFTTAADLKPLLEMTLNSWGVDKDVQNDILNKCEDIIKYLEKTKEWQRYLEETEALKNDPNAISKRFFDDASRTVNDNDYGLIEKDLTYINAAREALLELSKAYPEDAKKIEDVASSIEKIDETSWNANSTESVARSINGLADAVGNKNLAANLNFLKGIFVDMAGTRTGIAANIATKLTRTGVYSPEFLDYANRYIPTDETLEKNRNDLISQYETNKKYIEEHSNDSIWKERIDALKKENEFIKLLGSKDLYDINFDKKTKSGSSGSNGGGYRQFFAEFFSLIKEARSEQEKLSKVTGLRGTFKSTVETFDDENVIKNFYVGNPFESVMNKIEEFGLKAEGIFKKEDFDGISTKFGENGLVDYKAMWDDVLSVINKKIDETNNKTTKNALIRFRDQMVVEGNKLFSKIDVNAKIDSIIKSLGSIEANTEKEKGLYDVYRRMSEYMGYRSAGEIIYGNDSYHRNDDIGIIMNQLIDMMNLPGIGINDYSTGLKNLLNDNINLTVGSIGQIYDIIDNISKLESTSEDNQKELESIKERFINALKELVNSIISEDERIKDATTTESNNKAIKSSEAWGNYKQRNDYIELETSNKIRNGQAYDEVEYKSQKNSNKRRYWNELTDIFGGTKVPEYTNMDDKGYKEWNTLQTASGERTLLDTIIDSKKKEFIDNADKTMPEADRSKLEENIANEIQELTGKFDKANTILNSIKGVVSDSLSAMNSIVDAMGATNKAKKGSLKVDAAGNVSVDKRYDDNKLEMAKVGLGVVDSTFTDAGNIAGDIISGNFIKAAIGSIKMIVNLVKNISEAMDKESDLLQEENMKLIEQEDRWQSLYDYEQGYLAGIEKWNKQIDTINSKTRQNEYLQDNINKEMNEKSVDADQIQDWQDQIIENNREINDTIRGITEEILGTADELANTLGDAFVEAFRQGENAARAWRDATKNYIGDAIKSLLIAEFIAPQVKELLDMWAYGFNDIIDENGDIVKSAKEQAREQAEKEGIEYSEYFSNRLLDPKAAKTFEKGAIALGNGLTNLTNNLPQAIQDYLYYNSDSSSLGGGIQGITEDTARRIEAISNSQLAEVFSINNKMSSIQSDIAKTASNVALIYALMDNMSKGINRLHVTMD